ncbi:hypothetical protein ACWDPV_01725 [Gordonia sp. NPDC003504]
MDMLSDILVILGVIAAISMVSTPSGDFCSRATFAARRGYL